MHFTSLEELQRAYMSSTLSKAKDRVIIDHDSSYLYVNDEPVYHGPGPEALAREAFDLLGISWDYP